MDSKPLEGVSYYRLRQNDVNGEFDHSEIRVVERKGSPISIYPNPGSGVFRISGYTGQKVVVHEMGGRLVPFELSDAGELTLPQVSAGTYMVEIGDGLTDNLVRIRLIVQ